MDWAFQRMKCVYSGHEDHRTLGYLFVEGRREKMWAEVYEQCRGYLKVIPSFTANSATILAVEDLATVHLDYIAHGHGYRRVEVRHPAQVHQDRSTSNLIEVYTAG